jgi:hypothetical protein
MDIGEVVETMAFALAHWSTAEFRDILRVTDLRARRPTALKPWPDDRQLDPKIRI